MLWAVLAGIGACTGYNVNLGTVTGATIGADEVAVAELSCPYKEDTRLPDALIKLGKAMNFQGFS